MNRSDDPDAMTVIAAISHELRAPLTSLKGFTRLLLEHWRHLDEAQKQDLIAQIDTDASRIERLVGELLDIGRLESGRLTLRYEPVDVRRALAATVQRVAISHPQLRCTIAVTAGATEVLADPDKLHQVLSNLLENAAKYASPSDVVCRVDARDARAVEVCVDDAGPGIPDSELEAVFRPFFRRATAQPSGTGLGLWISRALVEAHGGTLAARPNARGGTSFCLTLPRSRASAGGRPD